jgi:hypothetical protein
MKKLIFFLGIPAILIMSCQNNGNVDGTAESEIRVTSELINDHFRGIGFHVFYHLHDAPKWHYEEIFAKRWRELNPSFARITDNQDWDRRKLDKISEYLDVMKFTETELYFTTWGTREINKYDNEISYVLKEVDNLGYLKNDKNFSLLDYYCMANELSVEHWASMVNDLDRFKRVQGLFYDELNKRNLNIKLLASDASPFSNWHTIEWAANNMDDITGVYGGHHYINGYDLFNQNFYSFFYNKMKWGADLAKKKGKNFIVGEFGPKQNSNDIDSIRHDACIYNNTPLERYMPVQLCEALVAMINGGIYAASYWTFSDFPSDYSDHYINKWGVFRWEVDNFTTKPAYYALGLFTKFLRGPAAVYKVNCQDTLLRVAAIKNLESNALSIAIVSRHSRDQKIQIKLDESFPRSELRKYVYDSEDPPFNYFGDLQKHTKKVRIKNSILSDTIPGSSIVVYTANYDEIPPAAVLGLKVKEAKMEGRDRNVLKWDPNSDDDFCYYRIYRSPEKEFEPLPVWQIATTISTEYIDRKVHGLPEYYYKVVAVDMSGNSSN